ncbi:MAG: hypothetical protein J6M92_16765 [Oribacterium sp.]|nr:hypothetical protein [Oribacterium sp.]
MAHLASEEYLQRDNINEYLDALAIKILETGIGQHRILFRMLYSTMLSYIRFIEMC